MKLISLTPNIMVEDVVKTAAYYEDLLDFEIVDSVPDDEGGLTWALISSGDVLLMLQSRTGLEGELNELENKETGGTLTFFIKVDDTSEIYDNLKEKVNILSDLKETFYGAIEFTFRDINGYIVTISQTKQQS